MGRLDLTRQTPYIFRRYAETQIGINGERYRDWVCVYASDQSVEKCRLEGHLLEIDEAYESRFPWRGGMMIHLRSSIRMDPKIYTNLQLPPPASSTSSSGSSTGEDMMISCFAEFTRAVRGRMLQDLKLLPVRDPSTQFVERYNVTTYTNYATSGQGLNKEVLIVYAPTSLPSAIAGVIQPQMLEFISFVLLPPT